MGFMEMQDRCSMCHAPLAELYASDLSIVAVGCVRCDFMLEWPRATRDSGVMLMAAALGVGRISHDTDGLERI